MVSYFTLGNVTKNPNLSVLYEKRVDFIFSINSDFYLYSQLKSKILEINQHFYQLILISIIKIIYRTAGNKVLLDEILLY